MAAPKKKTNEELQSEDVVTQPEPKAPRLSAVERLAQRLAEAQAKQRAKDEAALAKAIEEQEKAQAASAKAMERVRTTSAKVDELRAQLAPAGNDVASYTAALFPVAEPTEDEAEAKLSELEDLESSETATV